MHKLLDKLVSQYLLEDVSRADTAGFIDVLNQIFVQQDRERTVLEDSLSQRTQELHHINQTLCEKLTETSDYQRKIEETLAEQEMIINSTPEALFNFELDGNLKQLNKAACKFLNVTEDVAKKINKRQLIQCFLDKILEPELFLNILSDIKKDYSVIIQHCFRAIDGSYYECYSVPGFFDGKCIGRIWCFRDVTDVQKNQEQLQHQAFHDSLTGLPNRSLLIESIDHAIALAHRAKKRVAVLFIDLDDFKKINDTAGHEQGDSFLIHVSRKIQSVLRGSDIVGRLGGDEFLVILEGIISHKEIVSAHNRVIELFAQPFFINDKPYFVSCSIGVSFYPRDGKSPDVLIRKADMAMYQAKRMGKNTFQYFDKNLERLALHRLSTENELRGAIDENQFIFHYQPKVNLKTGAMIGVEALIRWEKQGKVIYPDEFIPVAEDTGLIRGITRLVVSNACATLNEWEHSALRDTPLSINISAKDFSDFEFIASLLSEIKKYNIAANRLELEITESVFFDNINMVIANIKKLKREGILISVDDFGTGYSSFAYLHDLDIDYLKIDKGFVQNLHKTKKSKAIVKSIIDLGVNLGIKIVAEGVESIDEHNFLLKDGCLIGQGYYYSRPLTKEALLAYLVKEINSPSLD